MHILWFFIIIGLAKADSGQSQCPPSVASIKHMLDEAHISGAAAVVLNSKKIIYEQGIGYHSPPISDMRQPVDASTSIFLLGSISKTFIAVAAMQMVELNLLNLDTDINQYLPTFMKIEHPNYPNITITTRHLLSHTAGIGPNFDEEVALYLPGDSFTQTNLGNIVHKYLSNNANWLPIPPGNVTFYSNVGTSLAAFIIERLAGVSFEHYVQDKILKPLGIDESKGGYRLSNFHGKESNLVDHYIYNASWLEDYQQLAPQLNASRAGNFSDWLYIPFYGGSIYPAGFLRMSAHSLALFLQSFLNDFPTLLRNSSSVREMLHVLPQSSYMNLSETKFGIIWNWSTLGQRRLVGHRGSVPGMTNTMMANEDRTLGVIVLTNGDMTRADDQAKQVVETISKISALLFDCFDTPRNTASHLYPNLT